MSPFKSRMVAAFVFLAIACTAVIARGLAAEWGWLK